ncbi:hypothetical protein RHGRI_020154 [Rhododendron griersonianum]|uniref:Uncharacterized protein n=1 Tax=Rhododendron griersonianum TaxID=479676 RepID=A0AAV6JJ86_9ERIC|nr:hypothetical protein RHGRI_020154 [Rhododendron griersonianum]
MGVIGLGTLEARRGIFPTNIKKQGEGERDVKADAQDVCLDGSAKANSSLKISKALDETAARSRWRSTHNNIDQPTKQINTDT